MLGTAIEYGRWQYIYQKYREKYEIHPTFKFNGPGISLYGEGRIILGANSYIGRYSSIQSYAGCKVEIGKNCAISHYVMIYTANRIADQDFSKSKKIKTGNVYIGDNCWIGAHVFINQGVSIGENAVVGAHSVVTKNIPPHSIAVGVPAKVIKFKSYLSEDEIKELAKRYWDSLHPKLKTQLFH